jgi:hypothetical protein
MRGTVTGMTMTPTTSPDVTRAGWNYIPVPAEMTPEVLVFVGGLMAERGMAEGPEPFVGTDEGHLGPAEPAGRGSFSTKVGNPNGCWVAEGYATLRRKSNMSAHRAVRIGDALCDAGPGTLISMTDLAQRTDMTPTQVRSALGKLTQFVAANPQAYPHFVWPFGWYYGRQISAEKPREFHYVMDAEQRSAWAANR